MRAIDRLKRDHKVLRGKLDVIENALRLGPSSTWFVLRELCYTLSRQIADHIRREDELINSCRSTLNAKALAHTDFEHHDEPEVLRRINHLFVEDQGETLMEVKATLKELIPRLRHHLEEEEQDLFPTLERVFGSREESQAPCRVTRSGLREDMTLNRIVNEYPVAGAVLSHLFVNLPFEGHDCLDEVAWRHGLNSQDILTRLEQAIAIQGTPKPRPQNRTERVAAKESK